MVSLLKIALKGLFLLTKPAQGSKELKPHGFSFVLRS